MTKEDLSSVISRRTLVLSGGQLVLFSVLFGRMFYLQIIKGKTYKKLANNNRIRIKYNDPERGLILDKNGKLLAGNESSYNVFLVPEESFEKIDPDDFLTRLEGFFPLSDDDKAKIKKDIKNKKKYLPTMVKEDLDWETMEHINFKNLEIPGTFVEEGFSRVYPLKEATAHLIGYTGRPSIKELKEISEREKNEKINPDLIVGKTAIEKQYDAQLRGKNGSETLIVNSYGRTVEKIESETIQPEKGQTLTLTIDSEIQEYAQKLIKDANVSASVCVLNANTGEVLSLVSGPSFDPNMFNGKDFDSNLFAELLKDERRPFTNKNIEGTYPPASTFKAVVALAALEDGWDPDRKIKCTGVIEYANHKFHCWKKDGHGPLSLRQAIQHSCDVYFYQIAIEVGIDKIFAMAEKFGLTKTSGIDLPNEKSGRIPNREWKKKNIGVEWYHGDSIITSIGQGYCLVNNVQQARMIAMIANNGVEIQPHILKNKQLEDVKSLKGLGIKSKNFKIVQDGLYMVINEKGGTAMNVQVNVNGKKICGKTGTAQVKRISEQERATGIIKGTALPWKYRNHSLFVAYAPQDKPEYAISVIVEHGDGGGTSGSKIGSQILKKLLEKM